MKTENLLDQIITITLARDAGLTEEDMRLKLGIKEENDKGEDANIRELRFTLLTAITKELLKATTTVTNIQNLINILEEK